jgi:hypothetical protein
VYQARNIDATRRALSPDARLLPRVTASKAEAIVMSLRRARQEEGELVDRASHAALLALKRVEIVELEDSLERARIAMTYRNPDS